MKDRNGTSWKMDNFSSDEISMLHQTSLENESGVVQILAEVSIEEKEDNCFTCMKNLRENTNEIRNTK
jgi:hypothetical protein